MRQPKVAVIGLGGQSAFMKAEHFPAPGETIHSDGLFFELGGKGYNQAVACARMGVGTLFVGAVGNDIHGTLCREDLQSEGIEACLVIKDQPTAFAVITTAADGENTVQVYGGAAKALTGEDLQNVAQKLGQCSCLLLQNELSGQCLYEAVSLGERLNLPVILNPAPAGKIPPEVLRKCSLLTPNWGEAKAIAGFDPEQEITQQELADAFARLGLPKAVITMGAKGAMITEKGSYQNIPPFRLGQAVDTTGAGDTFNGVLAARLAQGSGLEDACRWACVAAGIGVTRPGARGSIPGRQEIEAYLTEE